MTNTEEVVKEQTLNFLSGKSSEDPFSLFAKLRSIGSVVSVPNPMDSNKQAWMITDMDEAMNVLKDNKRFTVDPKGLEDNNLREDLANNLDSSTPDTFFTGNSMLFVDGVDHKRLRKLVSRAFTPKYMEELRPRVQQIADELLDQVIEEGAMDIVKDYAYPLPINVISEMLGVPTSDRKDLQTWSSAIAKGLGWGRQDPSIAYSLNSFGNYTKQLVEEKRKNPGNDLISQLIIIEEEGDRLSESELISMITLLIFAGHETTSNLIATGTMMLLDHPKQLEHLKSDLGLVPTAVEELLRFNGPSTSVGPRFAKEDIIINNQKINKGDMLLVLVKSANRDEQKFYQPDELNVMREIDRHLAFGQGIHMCLGAPLARIEGDIAFTTMLRRIPNIELNVKRDELDWDIALSSQSLNSLPVTF
ncbi:cytochrome P450 family protein [Geomicrobium sediminis]|uniref:Cytochrome P450 n=1 Tax=Geomicrobium sediminis TaxID=1347788 RepID=A0ABS2PAG6_9BACL|nr:cytochrome P450 [Geomicrobium sediminis]MBM7632351.1 cytochrome P450 [Geomicrobium sediminis]